jgi:hypothetical protein
MRRLLPAAAALAAAASPAGAAATPAGLGLSAVPARVTLVGRSHAGLTVRNTGSRRVVLQIAAAPFALDLRGKPRIVGGRSARRTARWLSVRPRRVVLAPGASAPLVVSSAAPRRAAPGDHDALLLLTTRPVRGASIRVRLRVGVVVVLRVHGRIVRRLVPRSLVVRRRGGVRRLELGLVNRGNVTELVDGRRLRLLLLRHGRRVASLRPLVRELLPHGAGLVEFRYPRRLRGRLTARLEVALPRSRFHAQGRRFRVRL